MTYRFILFNKNHHIWICLLTFNIIKLLLRYLFRSLPWKRGKPAETHREENIPPWEHFYNRLVAFIHMSHLLKCGMCGMGHRWAAHNDLLSPRGGPDLWWTPGGPVAAAEATGRHSTLKHSLTICTQLDLRGELLEHCLASVLYESCFGLKCEDCFENITTDVHIWHCCWNSSNKSVKINQIK